MFLGFNYLNLYVSVHFHCVTAPVSYLGYTKCFQSAPDSEFPGQEAPSLTGTVFCFLPSYKYTILNLGLNITQK